jgi:hypothetical protein
VTSRAAARRQRIQHIRVTVAGVALTVFIALFATIYVQMASGHDPVLAKRAAATATATPTTPATSAAPATAAAPATTTTAPAPVTTAQS